MENLYKLTQFYLNVLFYRIIQQSERISIVFLPWNLHWPSNPSLSVSNAQFFHAPPHVTQSK
jgi:hypothetical protein